MDWMVGGETVGWRDERSKEVMMCVWGGGGDSDADDSSCFHWAARRRSKQHNETLCG